MMQNVVNGAYFYCLFEWSKYFTSIKSLQKIIGYKFHIASIIARFDLCFSFQVHLDIFLEIYFDSPLARYKVRDFLQESYIVILFLILKYSICFVKLTQVLVTIQNIAILLFILNKLHQQCQT